MFTLKRSNKELGTGVLFSSEPKGVLVMQLHTFMMKVSKEGWYYLIISTGKEIHKTRVVNAVAGNTHIEFGKDVVKLATHDMTDQVSFRLYEQKNPNQIISQGHFKP